MALTIPQVKRLLNEHMSPSFDRNTVEGLLDEIEANGSWRIPRMLEIIREAYGLVEALHNEESHEEIRRRQQNLISVLSYEDWTIPPGIEELERNLRVQPTKVPDGCLDVGHQVQKSKGYPFLGEVRAVFKTKAGLVRYVVEATGADYAGMLHIFSPDQLSSGGRDK